MSVAITATLADRAASLTINDAGVNSGEARAALALQQRRNAISVQAPRKAARPPSLKGGRSSGEWSLQPQVHTFGNPNKLDCWSARLHVSSYRHSSTTMSAPATGRLAWWMHVHLRYSRRGATHSWTLRPDLEREAHGPAARHRGSVRKWTAAKAITLMITPRGWVRYWVDSVAQTRCFSCQTSVPLTRAA